MTTKDKNEEEKEMSDVEKLFYTPTGKNDPIEGYLSDEAKKDCKILFVLKEPNSGGYDKPSGEFWMKRAIDPRNHISKSGKYLRTLGTLAARLLCVKHSSSEDNTKLFKDLLRKCAFINIYPFSGAGKAGERYDSSLFEISKQVKANSIYKEDAILTANDANNYGMIASNRIQLIRSIQCKYVVTVCGAFEAIVGKEANACNEGIKIDGKIFRAEKDPISKRIIAAYYHPGARHIQHEKMDVSIVTELYNEMNK